MMRSQYEEYCEIIETGLFQHYNIHPDEGCRDRRQDTLRLIGTGFEYIVFYRSWIATASIFYLFKKNHVSFEEVLENVPAEIQTQLLFHLDLFR